jgi:hypothetical protein
MMPVPVRRHLRLGIANNSARDARLHRHPILAPFDPHQQAIRNQRVDRAARECARRGYIGASYPLSAVRGSDSAGFGDPTEGHFLRAGHLDLLLSAIIASAMP